MARIRLKGKSEERCFELTGSSITIGRGSRNTIPVEDAAVSVQHAHIEKRARTWWLFDRQSLNGTFLNGRRTKAQRLRDGDRVLLGATLLHFENPGELEDPSGAPSTTAGAEDRLLLNTLGEELSSELLRLTLPLLEIEEEESGARRTLSMTALPADRSAPYPRWAVSASTGAPEESASTRTVHLAEKKLALIQELSEKLVSIFEPAALMEAIVSIVVESTGADRGLLCLLDEKLQATPVAAQGFLPNTHKRISRSVLEKVLDARSGVLIRQEVDPLDSLVMMDVHSTICVPLWTAEQIVGLLSLDSLTPGRLFTGEQLEVMIAIAHQAAIGIQRLHLDQEVQRQRRIREYLSKYIDERVMAEIEGAGATCDPLAARKQEVTILFADIVSFTKLSEGLDPSVLAEFVREYLSALTEIVFDHGGTIDKYIGDSLMALFGAPIEREDDAARAVRAALAMRERAGQFTMPGAEEPLRIRIGINTGPVVVGNLGSRQRTEYSALGDAVNVASRLEALAKPNEICIDERTAEATGGLFRFEKLGPVVVKNRLQPVMVLRVVGGAAGSPDASETP
ncbi:MAG TPA: adenylate/guanylate cyclase domain-containing protein [Thermoanaerobaculia bacterium]|nr:adenylate/guanylate cyclase domain-containing protein [Thermoanaerobaculia bacterium]